MIINDPATLAEVTAAFNLYERALMGNDLAGLDALFWESEYTVRYGVGESLKGIDAIRDFRRNRIGGSPQRTLQHTLITTFGNDLGTANTQFLRANSTQLGRQSQTWVRLDEGWRIVAAHVSMAATFS